MSEAILGLSAFYHDSAAALLVDGQIVAAAQEERFTRKKHDPAFPANAMAYVMAESGLRLSDLAAVAFYDKPYLKFERLLETYHGFAPRGLRSFIAAMPVWIKEKLMMRTMLKEELAKVGDGNPPVLFPEHHLSHAASAFYPSPFPEAAILTVDGVGEWATSTIGFGQGRELTILRELQFPHSLGLLYSAFTYYCGFKVNSGEYKLMGLAPYGNPDAEQTQRFKSLILDELVDLREDGSLLLNMDYFNFATGLTMCRDDKWESLFGVPRRPRESQVGPALHGPVPGHPAGHRRDRAAPGGDRQTAHRGRLPGDGRRRGLELRGQRQVDPPGHLQGHLDSARRGGRRRRPGRGPGGLAHLAGPASASCPTPGWTTWPAPTWGRSSGPTTSSGWPGGTGRPINAMTILTN